MFPVLERAILYGDLWVIVKDHVTMILPALVEECLLDSFLVQKVYMLSKYGDRSSSRSGDFTFNSIWRCPPSLLFFDLFCQGGEIQI